jgi:hypothetical protein
MEIYLDTARVERAIAFVRARLGVCACAGVPVH